jgi:hypothetical protein
MATLREYYEKDQGRGFGFNKSLQLTHPDKGSLLEVLARLDLDFESNSLHVSFYVPSTTEIACPGRILLNGVDEVLKLRDGLYMEGGMKGEDPSRSTEAVFTGRVYIYSEDEIGDECRALIEQCANELGQSVKIRGPKYASERTAWERPLAFISHDSRDKELLARPLALALQKQSCPVWYDEFSLKVGDSLRDSIERGIKECHKCVFVITPNFLANGGWTKREYDSIFTRELIERENVILPVWSGVSPKEIYEYSPILADRVAAQWSDNVDDVARKLVAAIRA